MHAELFEDVIGIAEHVHQVRDRRALIARHVRHAGFQQRLGNRQDSFAAKFLAAAEFELLHFFFERSFGHGLLRFTDLAWPTPGARFGRLLGKICAKYRSVAAGFTSALSLKYLGALSRRRYARDTCVT